MRTQQTVYAPELRRDVTIAALSGAGLIAVHNVSDSMLPDGPKKLALMLEHLRDGMVEPEIKTDKELVEFVERYPDLTARLFIQIRKLTESLVYRD